MTTELMEQADHVIAKTYKRFPVVFSKGEGCTLFDTDRTILYGFCCRNCSV